MAENGRILAIDFGEKRIGLALSDPFAIIASGLGVIPNDAEALSALASLVKEQGVIHIIVGLPLTMKGEEGKTSEMVRRFVERIQTVVETPIELVDERLTSVMAADTIRQLGVGKKKREKNKGKMDEISAVHLLQGYLQSRAAGL